MYEIWNADTAFLLGGAAISRRKDANLFPIILAQSRQVCSRHTKLVTSPRKTIWASCTSMQHHFKPMGKNDQKFYFQNRVRPTPRHAWMFVLSFMHGKVIFHVYVIGLLMDKKFNGTRIRMNSFWRLFCRVYIHTFMIPQSDPFCTLCTEVIIEHMFVSFIQNIMVVFTKRSNKKIDIPHNAILNIAPCAKRLDGISKPAQWRPILSAHWALDAMFKYNHDLNKTNWHVHVFNNFFCTIIIWIEV